MISLELPPLQPSLNCTRHLRQNIDSDSAAFAKITPFKQCADRHLIGVTFAQSRSNELINVTNLVRARYNHNCVTIVVVIWLSNKIKDVILDAESRNMLSMFSV